MRLIIKRARETRDEVRRDATSRRRRDDSASRPPELNCALRRGRRRKKKRAERRPRSVIANRRRPLADECLRINKISRRIGVDLRPGRGEQYARYRVIPSGWNSNSAGESDKSARDVAHTPSPAPSLQPRPRSRSGSDKRGRGRIEAKYLSGEFIRVPRLDAAENANEPPPSRWRIYAGTDAPATRL